MHDRERPLILRGNLNCVQLDERYITRGAALSRGIGRERNSMHVTRLNGAHGSGTVALQEHAEAGWQELWAEGQVGPRLVVAGCCGL